MANPELRSAILEADRRFVWRPYTSAEDQATRDPLVVTRAEGVWLHDADGRRYLDANGSWWVNTLGHGHPRLRAAAARQLESLVHCSLAGVTHEGAAFLARELVAVAPPGLERVFFSDDGSTAVEIALKMAFQYWRQNARPERTRFISLAGAFHGDTTGAMSVSGVSSFRDAFAPLLFDVVHAGSPDAPELERAVEEIERLLARDGHEIAGVIVEPLILGAAGMWMYQPALLARLREATRRVDTFLIADEVFTGYGRTGRMWACDHAGIAPDLLCTSKAFGGGMLPFAATLATARIFDGFRGGKPRALMHGHSYTGNPLGAAIAREVLAVYREEGVVAGVAAKAERLTAGFAKLAAVAGVTRVRTRGLVGAMDLGSGGYFGELGWRIADAARARGVYLRPLGDTVYVAPPLTIAIAELDHLLDVLLDSTREACAAR